MNAAQSRLLDDRATCREGFDGLLSQDFILGYFHPLPPGMATKVRWPKSCEIPGLKIQSWGTHA